MTGEPRLSRAEREQRDDKVLRLFLAGLTYREVGAAVGLRSVSGVHRIVQRQLAAGAPRRDLLTNETFALWQERIEALFQAHWDRAIEGDHRSSEICRKLLAQQAHVYGLGAEVKPLPAPTQQTVDPGEDEPQDELSKLRMARARPS